LHGEIDFIDTTQALQKYSLSVISRETTLGTGMVQAALTYGNGATAKENRRSGHACTGWKRVDSKFRQIILIHTDRSVDP
jgi:hypothetical protein